MFRYGKIAASVGIFAICAATGCRCNPTDSDTHAAQASAPLAQRDATALPELTVMQLPPGIGVVVDGKLDEGAWKYAASTGEFVNVGSGAANDSPSSGGRAWLTWDAESLYVGLDIRDADIRGDFKADASDPHLWTQSTAEIMIDPDGDGDNRDYYEIQIGPQNLIFDSQFDAYNQPRVTPNGPFGHQEWTAGARTAVLVRGTLNDSKDRDDGYSVEAQIPWKSFAKANSAPPRSGDIWRVNFYAMKNNGGLAWSPILGQGNFHKASRFGKVKWVSTSKSN